jgi:glycine hydroxymethyltransferase
MEKIIERHRHLGRLLDGEVPPDADAAAIALAAGIDAIAEVAPDIADAVAKELQDQRSHLKLIASENYASPNVLAAMGNWMSDKYAEGHPGHRWYAGCENVDVIESRAAELACALFGSDHAYVQPHSGIDANLVAFWAILTERVERPVLQRHKVKNPLELSEDDWEELRLGFGAHKLMGMAFDAGGHLTHGYRPNISGKLFERCSYGLDPETDVLDYDAVREQALRERPLILLAGYSSYSRKINFRIFREIADEIDAVFMVDMAHFAGLVAGGVFAGEFDPIPYADIVTTTTHKTLRGPRGGTVLCRSELTDTVNRGCPMVLGGPLAHIMAAKAVAFAEASRPEFRDYARAIVENSAALAESLMSRGNKIVSGGTDNHLVMLDVRNHGLTGMQGENALRACGITANRNIIPNDPNGAWHTSGVRLGTAAVTTLGMGKAEMDEIAGLIHDTLAASSPNGKAANVADATAIRVRKRVAEVLEQFPLYPSVAI